jgi:hypothetical protein
MRTPRQTGKRFRGPLLAHPLQQTSIRIPDRPKVDIRRVEFRFTGRNYRFIELTFLSSSGSTALTVELSRPEVWGLTEWLLDESIRPFPDVPAKRPGAI